ncbi:MAG: (Na+)-NQR maturation NqrM [Pseudomonadota bacterium]
MATFILSFVLLALVMVGMAAGVLLGRNPIQGSCGGLSSGNCSACTRTCSSRPEGAAPAERQGD